MRQVLDSQAVNLISSHTTSRIAGSVETVDLPQTFFLDSEGLTEILGLEASPAFGVSGAIYAASLDTFGVALSDRNGFERVGDTHFAFLIPERAFEDQSVLREALRIGLLTERFAACLLMTDFPNPVFSPRRAQLLGHVPAEAQLTGGSSGFSEEMAETILAAAPDSEEGSPEREFAERWATGEQWRDQFNRLLADYFAAIIEALRSQAGFDAYLRLAEARRDRVRAMPINESPLLFARTNIAAGARTMRADGTVLEA
jgi:hypothetical protein